MTHQARQHRGRRNFLQGAAAEDRVANHYQASGYTLGAKRWRGKSGELDLVFCAGDDIVIVEVKSSSTFDAALAMVTQSKAARILAAAAEYLCTAPLGLATPTRIDVACVNAMGEIDILENALGH